MPNKFPPEFMQDAVRVARRGDLMAREVRLALLGRGAAVCPELLACDYRRLRGRS